MDSSNAKPTTAQAVATVQANAGGPLFIVKDNSVLALQISLTMEKARKHNKDKGNFTVEYFCEEMLSEKLKTYSDYLDADEDRKNRELFVKAMNVLPTPDMTNPVNVAKYVADVENLKRRFRQGSYKPKPKAEDK